ncbi:MAG: ATP-binding cassette domain-containing protein [Acidobacteria bacterium]|nr:ATP-binding cassette domain-containing protein [Acidobacteriota bacterium]
MIHLEQVCFRRGPSVILDHVTLAFENNRRTALIGRSGSGKSTLLRLINRLLEPTSGQIRFGQQPIDSVHPLELRRSIGFVSQHLGLFPHWTARQQIARFHQHSQGVEELAASFGLAPQHLDRYPHQLSGGQQQRVAIARALASNPPILLLDEPFSALDPILRRDLQDLILTLDKTIVFVTHDLREALRIGEQLVFLRNGKIAFNGPAPTLAASEDPEIRAYLETLR